MIEILTPESAAQQLLLRKSARASFAAWCELANGGLPLAKHHKLIIDKLQKAVEDYKKGKPTRLMILMPPGSAKSTYTSKLFPPWFLGQQNNLAILACSHSDELATDFGRAGRNLVDTYSKVLGYELSRDSRAADSWETSNGSYYRAAGCGAGIAGRRADLGLIDDFAGNEEEVLSKSFNDKIWNWYVNDLIPRLKPNAIRILICNHRNEDDLAGRLMSKEANLWEIIRIRLLIETEQQALEDPLGRARGEWLWPEYFTKDLVLERMRNPSASGLEQQEPSPQSGDFFESSWIDENTYEDINILKDGQIYGASDHAVSEAQSADDTCMGLGVYKKGILYIHPDLVWDRIGPEKTVSEFLRYGRTYSILRWRAEKGHISKSLMPFLQKRMMDEQVFFSIYQVTPVKDKQTRAHSIKGMMQLGLVKWPSFAPWFQRARRQLLMFPNGRHDDFVDFLSHLGMEVNKMFSDNTPKPSLVEEPDYNAPGWKITLPQIKAQNKFASHTRWQLTHR